MGDELKKQRDRFFDSCSFVAKAPGSFFWTGEHSAVYGHLAIIQALPLYIYTGIEVNDFSNFEYEFVTIKKNMNLGIDEIKIDNFEKIDLGVWQDKNRVEEYLKFWKTKTGSSFFKIKVWNEIPPKCGLNSSGALASSLASLLYCIENKNDKEKFIKIVESWKAKDISQLRKDKIFSSIFVHAWALDDCFHYYSSSGSGPISSMIGAPEEELILYITEKRGFDSIHPIRRIAGDEEILKSENYHSYIKKLEDMKWSGKKFPIPSIIKEKLGVSLIYSGQPKDTGGVLEYLSHCFDTPIGEFKKLFFKYFQKDIELLPKPASSFVREYPEKIADSRYYSKTIFMESLGLLSWHMLLALENENIEQFQKVTNCLHDFLCFYGVFKESLVDCFKEISEINKNVAVKLSGAGFGGNALIFGNRDEVEKIENRILDSGKYNIHYSSNKRGLRADHLSVVDIEEFEASELLKNRLKAYEVYIEGKLKPMTRKEVEDLESHKNEYLAWIWVDDEKSEIIVDKKKKDINPDTVVCKFLIAILKRVGKDLPHEIIEKEVNIKDIHQHLNKLKAKTDHVLDKYIEGTRWRFKIHSFKSCLIIKRDIQ